MLQLAFRNLFRNARRTVITVTAIGFGLSLVFATVTLQAGTYDEMIRAGVRSLSGHVVVAASGWHDSRDGDLVVSGVGPLADAIRFALPDAVVAPRLQLGGLLVSPRASVGVAMSGVDGATEAVLQDIDDKLTEGEWIDGDGLGIVLGVQLAETLQVSLGDKVVYMGQHGGATEVNSRLFRVKGLFRSGVAEVDGFVAWVDLRAAQEAFGQPDVAHQITVHLPDVRGVQDAQDRVVALVDPVSSLEVLPWSDALKELTALIEVDKVSNGIMLGVLGLIVSMGALNTVLMSVLERTKEFGVLMAIGIRPARLAGVVMLEGLLLGGLGAVFGALLGGALSAYLVFYGLDQRGFMGESYEAGGVILNGLVFGQFDGLRMGAAAAAAVGMTGLAALYPALWVAKLQPVDAMRHS